MDHTGHRVARRFVGSALALTLLGLPLACGDDDGDETTTTAEEAQTTEPTESSDSTEPEGEVVEVTLADYEFQGLPAEVPVGTTLRVTNASDMELHELVALKLPDDEERPVDELLALPPEEQEKIVPSDQEPAMVLLAAPGSSEQIEAVGTGTFTEPGRYLVACFIPTGADPQAYLDAASSSEGGPPEVEGGPPHFTEGMYAELIVTE
jgi:uncharacterized cupredoxin-like copper-binding protein